MKIAGIILAVLMLAGSALVGAIGSSKAMDLGKDIAQVTESLPEAQLEKAGFPSPGRLKFGGIVGILAAVASVALLVVTFVKRDKVMIVAGAALGLGVLAMVLYPSLDVGPTDGMAPRPQAMLAGGLALVGAVGAFMAKKASDKS